MKKKQGLIFIFFACILLFNNKPKAQQMVKASVVVQQPGDEVSVWPYQINIVCNGEIEIGRVVHLAEKNAAKEIAGKGPESNLQLNIAVLPSYSLAEVRKGKKWSLCDEGRYKTAVREKRTRVHTDSSAYFSLKYVDKFETIAGFNCQKVIVINSITNVVDSIYVAKELNYLKYRMTDNKYGKIDFVVRAYEHSNGRTQTFTIISAKEELMPIDAFKIPRDYKRFYSKKRYKRWSQRKAIKKVMRK